MRLHPRLFADEVARAQVGEGLGQFFLRVHGVRAIEDPALVERLAEERIVLEICPASNIALGVFADYASHPFNRLRDAGVKVTLNSDDPPHFHSSLANEYRIASDHFGLDDAALKGITRTAIEAAFCDDDTRTKLLGKLGQAII